MDSFVLEPAAQIRVPNPAVLERRILEAKADELELIAAVDAASRLFRNSVLELRHHRANKGQQVKNQNDTNWALLSDALRQVGLLHAENEG